MAGLMVQLYIYYCSLLYCFTIKKILCLFAIKLTADNDFDPKLGEFGSNLFESGFYGNYCGIQMESVTFYLTEEIQILVLCTSVTTGECALCFINNRNHGK